MKKPAKMKMFVVLFTFIIFATFEVKSFGVPSRGENCTQLNTAYLSLRNPRLPIGEIKCVDVTSLGAMVIPTHVDLIKSAHSLFADYMLLKIIPSYIVEALPKLELADFSRNKIRHMDPGTFSKNPKLKILILSENNIYIMKKQPLLVIPSLTTLHLSKNKIKRLSPATFREMPKLVTLYLDGNQLTRIHPKVFKPLNNLQFLHLGSNKLKKVPPKSYMPKSLATYIVKGNPLNSTSV